jgi:hypothetical protein
MRKLLPLGLVTAAALFFSAPVAASEVRSTQRDVEELQGMIQRSQERQGIVPAPAPIALEPVQTSAPVEPDPAPAPIVLEPVQTSAPVEPDPAPAPIVLEPVQTSAPVEPDSAPAPIALEPVQVQAPAPTQYSSAKDTASTITPPACLGREWPQDRNSLAYQLNRYDHMVCLLVTDEAWKRADLQNYGLGADLERGMPTLTAMRKHAPHLLPRALAILRGEKIYT